MPRLGRALTLISLAGLLGLGQSQPAAAAGMVVTTLDDAIAADGLCSLREAMTNANANAAVHADCASGAGADAVSFALSGTIVLGTQLPAVTGAGGPLALNGSGQTVTLSGGGATRLLQVASGGALTLDALTLRDGLANGHGGAILSAGSLNLTRVTISNSTAQGRGGAIYSQSALVASDSTFSGNRAQSAGSSGGGGAIYQLNGSLTLTSATVDSNSTDFQGGGLFLNGAIATVTSTTISGNAAGGGPGGGIMQTLSTLSLANSTLSANQALTEGGAIRASIFGTLTVANSTLAGNGAGVQAGGISTSLPIGALVLKDSILADNIAPVAKDCQGNTISLDGPNLIEAVGGCSYSGQPPLVGDAMLEPLANNGGPTATQALRAGSPALGTGSAPRCSAPPIGGLDQRTAPRPSGRPCDLGAYEATVAGGRDLRLSTTLGKPSLSWSAGNAQTGYRFLQYDTATSLANLQDVPATATAYTDTAATSNIMYCYAVAPYDWGGALGISDLTCALPGSASGSVQPGDFTLALGQTANATLTWVAPSGGADIYLLQPIPLDGSGAAAVVLPGSALSTVQPVPPAGACYQLAAYQGAGFGVTSVLCGIPGISTLGHRGVAAGLAELGAFFAEADLASRFHRPVDELCPRSC